MNQPPLPPDTAITITAIVPVLNDLAGLQRLVHRLQAMPHPPEEIIVVDGSAPSECRQLAESRGCSYLLTRAGRGHQLDVGAERAAGQVLWFLHADGLPPPTAADLIRRAVAAGAAGGFLRFQFAGPPTWGKNALAWLINLRTRVGIPYGDQGLFVIRQAYGTVGGFPDVPLFEEVPFVRALRRYGRFVQLPAAMEVSTRRWERDGWLRRTVENRLLALGYMLGISPGTLARRYRPIDKKGPAQC